MIEYSRQSIYDDLAHIFLNTISNYPSINTEYQALLAQAKLILQQQGATEAQVQLLISKFLTELKQALDDNVSPEHALQKAVVVLQLQSAEAIDLLNQPTNSDNLISLLSMGGDIDAALLTLVGDEGKVAALNDALQENLNNGVPLQTAVLNAQNTVKLTTDVLTTLQQDIGKQGLIANALANGQDISVQLNDMIKDLAPEQINTFVDLFVAALDNGANTELALKATKQEMLALADRENAIQQPDNPADKLITMLSNGEVDDASAEDNIFQDALITTLATGSDIEDAVSEAAAAEAVISQASDKVQTAEAADDVLTALSSGEGVEDVVTSIVTPEGQSSIDDALTQIVEDGVAPSDLSDIVQNNIDTLNAVNQPTDTTLADDLLTAIASGDDMEAVISELSETLSEANGIPETTLEESLEQALAEDGFSPDIIDNTVDDSQTVVQALNETQTPASEEPASEEPAPEEPAPEEPAPEEPAPEEPAPEEPVSEEPVSEEPAPEEPAPEAPVAETPTPVEFPEEPIVDDPEPIPDGDIPDEPEAQETQNNDDALDEAEAEDEAEDEEEIIIIPQLSVNDLSVSEQNDVVNVEVLLNETTTETISVDYDLVSGSAELAQDYAANSGTLTIMAGEISGNISLSILNDQFNEDEESFTLVLTNPTNATLDKGEAIITINDDDLMPTLTIDNVVINEDANTATFTVMLDIASGQSISVDVNTVDGSAKTLDNDYVALIQTLTFAPGETSQTVSVDINDDILTEADENFGLVLSNAVNATISQAEGTATIIANDDPVISIDGISVDEVSGQALLTVSLDQASYRQIQVNYATLDDSAVAGVDYNQSSGVVIFNPGEVTQTISIPIINDALDEVAERFIVQLSTPVNATINNSEVFVTINDSTPLPSFSISSPTLNEAAGIALFTVTLDAVSSKIVTVDVSTVDGTAQTSDNDYATLTQTLTFAPGETSKTVSVIINDDSVTEADESFGLALSNAVNATISQTEGTATITANDDPTISISGINVDESSGQALLTVNLDQASYRQIQVNYATSDDSAVAGADYTQSSGTLIFNPGQTTQTISIPITDDALDEASEGFTVQLNSPINATIANGNALITITDNNPLPSFSISSPTITEADGIAEFTISLDAASGKEVSVDVNTVDGTATALDNDYTALTQTLTFAPGETSQTVSIAINDDIVTEDDESFDLVLSNATNATISQAVGTATITANDDPVININGVSVDEDDGQAVLTVSLDQASYQTIQVNYTTTNDSAVAGDDYTQSSGIITFNPGDVTQTIIIPITNDALDEVAEQFIVQLDTPVNATIANGDAFVLINDTTPLPGLSVSSLTLNEIDGFAVFTITLDAVSSKTVTVDINTIDGTATAVDNDYTALAQTLTFAPGETSQTVSVTVNDDAVTEDNESFGLVLSNATNATISSATGTATITANDDPTISIDDISVNEGDGQAVVTVSLSQASYRPIQVSYTTADDSAVAGIDYIQSSGTLTFNPGEVVQTISVPIIDDALDEVAEQFLLMLSAPNNATIADGEAQVVINDNNPLPSFSISSPIINEDDGVAVFTIELDAVSAKVVTVDVNTVDGTAKAIDNDYVALAQTLTFAPGEMIKTVAVTINDDILTEADENFTLVLSQANNAVITQSEGTATIIANDDPTISVSDINVNEGSGQAVLTVSLDQASYRPIQVSYATSDGSALAGIDYSASSGVLTFNPGETTQIIEIPITSDMLDEHDEQFVVTLSTPINATIADAEAVVTINDNNLLPNISISSPIINEVDGLAMFTIELDAISGKEITVDVNTIDGTATVDDNDYIALTQTLVFASGETSKTVSVVVNNDTLTEADEDFGLVLSNSVNAAISQAQGTATILANDDPEISINGVSATEASGQAIVTVSLDQASYRPIQVNYTTIDDSALAGVDYTQSSGVLIFNPGETIQTINIPIASDALDEVAERFIVQLSTPVNASIANNQGDVFVTITDNDPLPNLSITNPMINEADGVAIFTISLDAASGKVVTVDVATADGTATVANNDYNAFSQTLTFLPGETSQTVSIAINDDVLTEDNENFNLVLSNEVNANISQAQGVATILANDDPEISIADITVDEGNGQVVLNVNLDQASYRPIQVNYSTANDSAVAGLDYMATSGTVTFNPGETTQAIIIPLIDDVLDEIAEQFTVNLDSPVNASIAADHGTALVTVTDNDPLPSLSVSSTTIDESDGFAVFTINLDAVSSKVVSVDINTLDGTASAVDNDYTAIAQTLVFAAGEMSKTVSIAINDDMLTEADESFSLVLSNATNAVISPVQGIATITANDDPEISIADITVNEGDGTAVLTVSLDQASYQPIQVNYATSDNSAMAGLDYAQSNGTVTFNPGETIQTITIPIIDDLLDEEIEQLLVNLNSPVNATLAVGQESALVTINDNDPLPNLSVSSPTLGEQDGFALFTINLDAPSSKIISIDVNTLDGTAKAGDNDYVALSQTLTFAPGETSKVVSVAINDDTLTEADEAFSLLLSNAVNTNISQAQGTATILANDDPEISISGITVNEGDGQATLILSLSQSSYRSIQVDYSTIDDSALAGLDYSQTNGTVIFNAGETTQMITIPIIDDSLDEVIEQLSVHLTAPINATIASGQESAFVMINDNDPVPNLSISSTTINEVDGVATFTIMLDAASSKLITVDINTLDGTAIAANNDYTAITQTLTFAPGEMSKTISVVINDDILTEADEAFTLNLSNANNANISQAQGTATILANDDPEISISDINVNEADGQIVLTVNLDQASYQTIQVNYTTADDSAVAGVDYTPTSGTLVFNPGEVNRTIIIPIIDDLLDEHDEQFVVNLSAPVNATIANNQDSAVVVISDDDPLPSIISISNPVINEADGVAIFTIDLDSASGKVVTVDVNTQDGSATILDNDYTQLSQTLTFNPGETSQTVSVVVNDDVLTEDNENFTLALSNAVNATISQAQGTATINANDDPVINILDATFNESDNIVQVAVSLDQISYQDIFIDYTFQDGTANDLIDYAILAGPATLTIPAGSLSATIDISINNDVIDEIDETFTLMLSNPINATLNNANAIVTIIDDDPQPNLTINDVNVAESGEFATFEITLDQASEKTVTVQVDTANSGSINQALAGLDYTAINNQTVIFNPGETSAFVDVFITDDSDFEMDENFYLNLSNAVNANILDAQGEGVIAINDALSITSSAVSIDYTEQSGSIVIDAGLTLTQVGSHQITMAEVSIGAGFTSGDVVSANSGGTSIVQNYNGATGVLTLSGNDTLANYQTVLQSVIYTNIGSTATLNPSREIIYTIENDNGDFATDIQNNININSFYTNLDPFITPVGAGPTIIDGDFLLSNGIYNDGFIRFTLSNSNTNDQFALTSALDPIANGAISVDGSEVYIGNGTSIDLIGNIDSVENGQNGNALKIVFANPLVNAGFETGDTTGWTVIESQFPNDFAEFNGDSIPFVHSGGSGNGTVAVAAPSSMTYTISVDSATVSSGDFALRLLSSGSITFTNPPISGQQPDGYGSIHGPYVESSAFDAQANNQISFDWSAVNGGDWYEVFGFLIGDGSDNVFNTGDDTRTLLFSQRGDVQNWTTVTTNIAAADTYKFQFISGTYDASGGFGVGASLYIDNFRVVDTSTIIDQNVLQSIAHQVSYQNTGIIDEPPRILTIDTEDDMGAIESGTTSLTVDGAGPLLLASNHNLSQEPVSMVDAREMLAEHYHNNHDQAQTSLYSFESSLKAAITQSLLAGEIESLDSPIITQQSAEPAYQAMIIDEEKSLDHPDYWLIDETHIHPTAIELDQTIIDV